MILLEVALIHKLPVYGFDDLSNSIEALGHSLRQLPLLVGAGHRQQADIVASSRASAALSLMYPLSATVSRCRCSSSSS